MLLEQTLTNVSRASIIARRSRCWDTREVEKEEPFLFAVVAIGKNGIGCSVQS
jgi:hypothetical protein